MEPPAQHEGSDHKRHLSWVRSVSPPLPSIQASAPTHSPLRSDAVPLACCWLNPYCPPPPLVVVGDGFPFDRRHQQRERGLAAAAAGPLLGPVVVAVVWCQMVVMSRSTRQQGNRAAPKCTPMGSNGLNESAVVGPAARCFRWRTASFARPTRTRRHTTLDDSASASAVTAADPRGGGPQPPDRFSGFLCNRWIDHPMTR